MKAAQRVIARILPLGLVAATLLTSGCAGVRQQRAADRSAFGAYLRGLMLERSAAFPDAMDAYKSALGHDRASPRLHTRIGTLYVKLGQPEEALRSFRRALALDPDYPGALRWMAMIYTSRGDMDEAIDAYERLLASAPEDRLVLSTLVDLYVLQGNLEQAVERSRQLIDEFGATSQLHFNLGVLLGRMERFDEAIAELSRAYERAPDSVEVRVALGLTYEMTGRFPEAAGHYEDAIRLDPFHPKLYQHAGRAHYEADGERGRCDPTTSRDHGPHDATTDHEQRPGLGYHVDAPLARIVL